jgi:hypothetical protein
MEKRIHWIRKKGKRKALILKRDSVMDDDSREAIEEYKSRCGQWNQ